jgi:uncharacterized membrane protein YqaE (UPF0057 family)
MRYLIAVLLPFVAMLLCGKVFQAIICFVLQCTVLGWLPAAIWAVMVVADHKADKRIERLIKAQQGTRG